MAVPIGAENADNRAATGGMYVASTMSARVDSPATATWSPTRSISLQLRELDRLPVLLFGVAALTAAGFIFYVGRGLFFHADDWSMVVGNWGLSPSTLLAPHVDHLIAVQVVLFELLRALSGWHYGAYRVVMIAIHLGVCACVFEFARRRTGAWVALFLVLPLLFLGAGADAVLWAAIMGNDIAILAGLGAWLMLDRAGPGRVREALACLLLVVAIASFSYGVVFAVLSGIWLFGTGRRRSVWVALVPLVLYIAWQIAYPATPITLDNVLHTPAFVFESAATELGAITGLGLTPWARVLAVVAVIALIRELLKPAQRKVATGVVVALPFLIWIETGIGRAGGGVTLQALQPRYIYPGVVAVVLAFAQLLGRRRLSPALAVVGGVLLTFGVAHNIVQYRDAGDEFRGWAGQARAYMAGVELAHPVISPEFGVSDFSDPGSVGNTIGILEVGVYDAAARRIGSEPVDLNRIDAFTPGERAIVDEVLVKALRIHLSALSAAGRGACVRELPGALGAGVSVSSPGATIRTSGSSATVYVRSYADSFPPAPLGNIAPHEVSRLNLPRDRSTRPWHVRAVASAATTICHQ